MSVFIECDIFMKPDSLKELQERLQEQCDEKVIVLPASCRVSAPNVLYECDRCACKTCNPDCHNTHDINHAVNFVRGQFGGFIEQR